MMFASLTKGTYPFLKKIATQHSEFQFYFMNNPQATLVYYEHPKKKSIFVSGKTYEIIQSDGEMKEKGFVTLDYIPVTTDGAKAFEDRLASDFSFLRSRYGVQAMRILKLLKKPEYVILTQWQSVKEEKMWKNSPYFASYDYKKTTRLSAYFAERSFTSEYYMVDEDDISSEQT